MRDCVFHVYPARTKAELLEVTSDRPIPWYWNTPTHTHTSYLHVSFGSGQLIDEHLKDKFAIHFKHLLITVCQN